MARLGGTLMIRNGIEWDYCFIESIKCLQEFCDEVVVVDAGSTDGTLEAIHEISDKKTTIISLSPNEWANVHGKEKLSIFTNVAIKALDTEYNFNLQADEILDPSSYGVVRKAVEQGGESYFCSRINLWSSPYKMLNVHHSRKPCSTEIVRLAKSNYLSYDDAESLLVGEVNFEYLHGIRIIHYGFIRKKEIHPQKIRHMQAEVFQVGVDPKLKGMDVFESDKWFTDEDLIDFNSHPKIMQEWIKTRP